MLTFGVFLLILPWMVLDIFFFIIVNNKSRFTSIKMITKKSETRTCLQNFINFVENQFHQHVKIIRSDNGSKFSMKIYFSKKCILHQRSCIEILQQNDVVERKHQHILNIAKYLLYQSSVSIFFWCYTILHIVHLIKGFWLFMLYFHNYWS